MRIGGTSERSGNEVLTGSAFPPHAAPPPAPYSPILAGVIGSNPTVIHDNTLPPASATYLIGMTFHVEAFVFDPGASNGAFHQPPAIAIQF